MAGSKIELSEKMRDALLEKRNLPDSIELKGKQYIVEDTHKAGFKGAIWKVLDEYARPRAAKLALKDDYEDRSYQKEMTLAARLEKYDEFARIDDAAIINVTLDAQTIPFVCFIEEWINGISLAEFLENNADEVTVSFLKSYVEQFCGVLAALEQEKLRHDDLHMKNIMLTNPAGPLHQRKIKIVDNGSLKESESLLTKEKGDHENFVDHIVQIWNCIFKKRTSSVHAKRFLSEVESLLVSMLDPDLSIALRSPGQIADRINEAFSRSIQPQSRFSDNLQSPFEFISAENISDDRILVGIFAKSCPWLEKVAGRDPCLVTGPRGCGKSTIFRWLSLKAHLNLPDCELDELLISGFYISCSSELQNRLSWIRTRALAEKHEETIVHFFNLLLAREILHTFELICERPDRETRWGMGDGQERHICDFILEAIGLQTGPRLQGLGRLTQTRECVESEMMATHADWLTGRARIGITAKSFIGDLTTLITKEIPYFSNRTIAFLIDDFSVHRLPREVQIILNRVVWERRGSHVFKLSAEKYGAVLTDNFDATAESNREMLEIDCGKEFVALDDAGSKKSLEFATELLENRLQKANYSATAEQIIGHSRWEEGALGRALSKKRKGGRGEQYHGLECIAQLCSGDVATLLMVYGRILELGSVKESSKGTVSKAQQDQAIREVSRRLFDSIRTYFPYGPELYSITSNFGTLVRRVMDEGKWHASNEPIQCPRIEIDQDEGGVVDDLNQEQRNVAHELIRRCIFIEMDSGLSRHRSVTTLRWQFRRVYLPAFGAALAKNDAVKRKPDWMKYFLTDPKHACDLAFRSFPTTTDTGKSDQKNLL